MSNHFLPFAVCPIKCLRLKVEDMKLIIKNVLMKNIISEPDPMPDQVLLGLDGLEM